MIRVRMRPVTDPSRVEWHVQTDHDRDHVIAYETLVGEPPATPDRADAGAILALARAANFRQDLHVEGPVSWSLLAGLEEWMDLWAQWRPDLYAAVTITADEVVDDRGAGPGALAGSAVAAFSGGVDSSYSLAAHHDERLGRRRVTLRAAVLVQGFDIPIDDDAGLASAVDSAGAIADHFDVPLVVVRTNWRDLCLDWQMEFGSALASVLHHFSDRAGAAVIAEDSGYGSAVVPWGTNRAAQPLLGSSRLRMTSVGGGLDRIPKCAVLATHPTVLANVRVCWEGDQPGTNCGRCEKCLRTALEFQAAGADEVPALPRVTAAALETVAVSSAVALVHWDDLLEHLGRFAPEVGDALLRLLVRAHDRFPNAPVPAALAGS